MEAGSGSFYERGLRSGEYREQLLCQKSRKGSLQRSISLLVKIGKADRLHKAVAYSNACARFERMKYACNA